jgi:hypothetical protein
MGRQVNSAAAVADETENILRYLAGHPADGVCSALAPVVRSLMLKTDGRIITAGRVYDIKAKLLGAGVYRLSLSYLRGERVR